MHDHLIIVYSFFAMIFGLGFCMKPFLEVNFYLKPLLDRCDFLPSARKAFFGQRKPLPNRFRTAAIFPQRFGLTGKTAAGQLPDRCRTAA
jgi:hypothetical protein